MAKKSKIVRELKLIRNVQKYAPLRSELKNIIKSPNSSFEEKEAAKAETEYIVAPNIKIGFLPYLSENGPDKICPRAKKIKYKVKTS